MINIFYDLPKCLYMVSDYYGPNQFLRATNSVMYHMKIDQDHSHVIVLDRVIIYCKLLVTNFNYE